MKDQKPTAGQRPTTVTTVKKITVTGKSNGVGRRNTSSATQSMQVNSSSAADTNSIPAATTTVTTYYNHGNKTSDLNQTQNESDDNIDHMIDFITTNPDEEAEFEEHIEDDKPDETILPDTYHTLIRVPLKKGTYYIN